MRILIFSVFIALCSCIDPYDTPSPEITKIVTVDGLISTAPGPHLVTLTYANQYTNRKEGNRLPLRDAQVSIEDENGCIIPLKEEVLTERWYCGGNGWALVSQPIGMSQPTGVSIYLPTGKYYTPEEFRAKVGSAYTLKVKTNDGQTYESAPELVTAVPEIENIEVRPLSTASLNPLIDSKGIELLVDISDPIDQANHYLWKLSHSHFTLITEPHLKQFGGTPPSCCEVCYIPDVYAPMIFMIKSDDLYNGLQTRQQTVRIMDDGIRFKGRFRTQLSQYAISMDAYQYLKLVRQQLDIQGSVFDPPPANIRGNIKNVQSPESQVLGYFIAADVSSKMIYINRSDIPKEFLAATKTIPDDCRKYCGYLSVSPSLSPPDDWEYN